MAPVGKTRTPADVGGPSARPVGRTIAKGKADARTAASCSVWSARGCLRSHAMKPGIQPADSLAPMLLQITRRAPPPGARGDAKGEPAAPAMAAGQGTRFSTYIEDLPIMLGLTETTDGYVVDLYQGGRLAQTHLAGEADAQVVRGFYSATLAQLGWRASQGEPYVYHRGRERLIFLVEDRAPRGGKPQRGLEAVFVITPEDQAALPATGPR